MQTKKPQVQAIPFVPKFATAADIDKAIESISKAGKKLDEMIQQCGLSVLHHIDKHGDITLFTRLYQGMPRGSRRNALVEWATQFGKLNVNLDDATKKDKPFTLAKDKVTKLEEAMAKPWYECKPEKPVDQEFDFVARLEALLDQAVKAREAGKPIKGIERLNELRPVVVAKAVEA